VSSETKTISRNFDEAVTKWLKDQVIALVPAGNPNNNTLALTGKKTRMHANYSGEYVLL